MTHPDDARAYLEEGWMEPLPPYVEWFALAEALNVPVPALADADPYLLNAARVMLRARSIAAGGRQG